MVNPDAKLYERQRRNLIRAAQEQEMSEKFRQMREEAAECESRNQRPVFVDTAQRSTKQLTKGPTSATVDAATAAAQISGHAPDNRSLSAAPSEVTESTASPAITSQGISSATADAEEAAREQAQDRDERLHPDRSLAETLLRSMGIPIPEHLDTESKPRLNLTPPLNTAKVAAAIAEVTLGLLDQSIAPGQGNALLFALQTLLGALRLNLKEEKSWERKSSKLSQGAPTRSARRGSPKTKSSKRRKAKR